MGAVSTLWFLVRVIPKPSRAAYPCMRATAPIMSGFVLYLISIASSVQLLRSISRIIKTKKYIAAAGLVIGVLGLIWLSGLFNNQPVIAMKHTSSTDFLIENPVGIPTGLNPGRVVWVWDTAATDNACTNTEGDYWFQNTDQEIIDSMLSHGICNLAGTLEIGPAWDMLFRYFNIHHEKGDQGYKPGEKVYVKINLTNSCCSVYETTKVADFERMDATPEVVLSILKQLIEVVGIEQSDIYIGDPFRTFHDLYWDFCTAVYPLVNYCDGQGLNGRHQTIPSSSEVLVFSDGQYTYRIPQEYLDASYIINIPCLKSHESGGITLAAKNHMGSMLQDGASPEEQTAIDMHYTLPSQDNVSGTHRYRHLVDFMGHESLGGKTMLIIVDGIWAGKGWEGWVEKWQMEPFLNDFPNSLFLSQDPVAIESVCWDFLLAEYAYRPVEEQYPFMDGIGDYLLQAADPTNWAEGIEYDPENDGSILGSLGVYEHWNNAEDMQYTMIDLRKVFNNEEPYISGIDEQTNHNEPVLKVYPNPFSERLVFEFDSQIDTDVRIELYDMRGRLIDHVLDSPYEKDAHYIIEYIPHGIVEDVIFYRLLIDGEVITGEVVCNR